MPVRIRKGATVLSKSGGRREQAGQEYSGSGVTATDRTLAKAEAPREATFRGDGRSGLVK